jgi:hypothetical protein
LKLTPFVLGLVLLEIGLIVFVQEYNSISNGNPPGGAILAPALGVLFLFGLLSLMYGSFPGKKP